MRQRLSGDLPMGSGKLTHLLASTIRQSSRGTQTQIGVRDLAGLSARRTKQWKNLARTQTLSSESAKHMANPEHLNRLLSGIEAWNTWRTQDNVVVDLSGANLAKAELPGANLWGAHLHRVTFHGANLAGAKFAQARLAGSNFFAAHLAQADFSHAALDLVTFVEANLAS